jgi:hypothetical protein
MSYENHPVREFVPKLQELAEGRTTLNDWSAWWEIHARDLQNKLLPGWLFRLKRWQQGKSASEQMTTAVDAASYILTALDVEHMPDWSFAAAFAAEREAAVAEIQRKNKARETAYLPLIEKIKARFPKLAALLKRRLDLINDLKPGMSPAELAELQATLRESLPMTLVELFRVARCIELEGFKLDANLFFLQEAGPATGMLTIADYFLDADGDQLLLAVRDGLADDSQVHYYAHSIPEVRPLGKSFSQWLDALGRSPLFRDG